MTISSTTRKAGPFTGDGIVVAFPFAFKVFAAADLLVVQTAAGVDTTKALTTDYTVTLNADQNASPGGSVTMLVSPPAGSTLTLTSQVANTQGTDLSNQGGFFPKVLNDALDRATIQIQQLADKLVRSLQLPLSSTASGTLPAPVASSFLGWDSLGTSIINYAGLASSAVSAAMSPVIAAGTLALARIALGVTTVGDALFTAANAAAGRTAIGFTAPVIDRAYAEYTATAALATGIPNDDTIPQVTEGTQVLSVAITPKSATSRLRLRFQCTFSNDTTAIFGIAAAFVNGAANAVTASMATSPAAAQQAALVLEYEWVPGTTAAQTITVRVGPQSGGGAIGLNGTNTARKFGGSSRATLVVEEIAA